MMKILAAGVIMLSHCGLSAPAVVAGVLLLLMLLERPRPSRWSASRQELAVSTSVHVL